MTKNGLTARFRDMWRSFRAADGGSTAIVFGLAIIPVIGLVGAAVDYSRASSMRTAMLAAADAAALAISSKASTQSQDALNSSASSYFRALFTRTDAQNLQVSAVYSSTAGASVVVNATASMRTNIMGIMGFNNIPISVTATAAWGSAKLRVALVLDNTGSMLETDSTGTSKISALKTASHNLLTILRNAAQTAGDVQVSIIPFSNFVKADPATYKTKPWINWGLNSGSGGGGDDGNNGNNGNNGNGNNGNGNGNNGNSGNGNNGNGNGNGGCNGGDDDDNNNNNGNGNGNGNPCNPVANNWNGCFTDRNQSYDVQNTAPTATNTNTYFPAVNCSLAQMMPLSYDWTALNSKIDAMVAAGSTNQPIGLAWGWHSMSTGDPMNAPALPSGTRQIVILLTDGLNTQDRWSTNQSYIDAREALVCANMKTAGITIYTVLVMSGNSTVLQNCASPDTAAPAGPKYFALTSAGQIVTTFNAIGTNLAKLHIAR